MTMSRTIFRFACCVSLLCSLAAAEPSDEAYFRNISQTVAADMSTAETDRESSWHCMSEEEQQEARSNIEDCLCKMQRAYEAQMAFALASLELFREEEPETYARALAAYREALRTQYNSDLESLRLRNQWRKDEPEAPSRTAPDAILDAPLRNNHGIETRRQMGLRIELRKKMLNLRQDFLRNQIEERCSAPAYEFLTDSSLPGYGVVDVWDDELTPRCKELLRLFDEAERCWAEYAEQGGDNYYSPQRFFIGRDTPYCAYFDLIFELWEHHETFLGEVLGGFCSEE